jgi:hypothetical protein
MTIARPTWGRRGGVLLLTLAVAAALPACGGGGGGGGAAPTTLPPAPVRTQVAGGNFTVLGVPAANALGFPMDVAVVVITIQGGTVEITADWTFPSSDIDIWFMNGSCTAAQAARQQCPIANRTTSVTAKPEQLNITGVPAGTYTVGFANFTNANESGNFQVFVVR